MFDFPETEHMLFDTHSHYDDGKFDGDRDEVIASLNENGIGWALDVGCSFDSIPKAAELARKHENVYFSVGFHPNDAQAAEDNGQEKSLDLLRSYLKDEKCLAIGEIGLDYHWQDVSREIQKKWLTLQLDLALETGYPVIIHDREAHGDVMEILREYKGVKGILHSFSGSPEMARELVKMGWYISFSGVLTFKNARKAVEAAAAVPLERILIETDAPYLAPTPFRGKLNHSGLMGSIAQTLADIKGISLTEAINATAQNTRALFGLKE
jgi:TatD DNase family protein